MDREKREIAVKMELEVAGDLEFLKMAMTGVAGIWRSDEFGNLKKTRAWLLKEAADMNGPRTCGPISQGRSVA